MTRGSKRKLARIRDQWTRVTVSSAMLGGGAQGAQGAVDSGDATTTLQEVVVTAQKRSEDLQRVPIGLEVLSSEDPTAPAGTQLPVTPKLKANATLRYQFNVDQLRSFAQATVIHQGASSSQLNQLLNTEMG